MLIHSASPVIACHISNIGKLQNFGLSKPVLMSLLSLKYRRSEPISVMRVLLIVWRLLGAVSVVVVVWWHHYLYNCRLYPVIQGHFRCSHTLLCMSRTESERWGGEERSAVRARRAPPAAPPAAPLYQYQPLLATTVSQLLMASSYHALAGSDFTLPPHTSHSN